MYGAAGFVSPLRPLKILNYGIYQEAHGDPIEPRRTVDLDDTLTPAEVKKVRAGIKQIKEGPIQAVARGEA